MDSHYESQEMDEIHPISEVQRHSSIIRPGSGLSRRKTRSMYSREITHSKKNVVNFLPSRSDGVQLFHGVDAPDDINFSSAASIEEQAEQIACHLEQDKALMEDKPKSEKDRLGALREMAESLTLKRSVKMKLTKTINKKSKQKPIGFFKRLRYRLSIFFTNLFVDFQNFLYSFELWYSSLKTIEGHFGSGVATYFKFLRRLFILNVFIFIVSLAFIVGPQLLYQFLQVVDDAVPPDNSNISISSSTETINPQSLVMMKADPYEGNDDFRFGNIFTGEGFFTQTVLYYGYYTNMTLSLITGYTYHMPTAYFFAAVLCYFIVFLILSVSTAFSYRKSFIDSDGVTNVFAHKIFCGWDFGIATKQAAELKSKSIHTELKELLDEERRGKKTKSYLDLFYLIGMQLSLNALIIIVVAAIGWYAWNTLNKSIIDMDTATSMMISLTLTIIIILGPMFFSWIVQFEGYESPRSALYITLVRTLILEVAVISFFLTLRLHRSDETECWETTLGQEVYRLILLDFLFGLVGTALAEFIRFRIFKQMWPKIGCPEFDIARNTMNLIYNQTLFYLGFYFSPVISFVIIVKMFLTFYIKKWGAIYNCKPSSKPWRAAQTHTVFLAIAFIAFFGVIIAYGYILTSVRTSNCGPFRGKNIMYEIVLGKVFPEDNKSVVVDIIHYVFRPGVVAVIILIMCLGVYYLRSISLARRRMVKILRDILKFHAKDKEFLMRQISEAMKRGETYENHASKVNNVNGGAGDSNSKGNFKLSEEQKKYEELIKHGRKSRNPLTKFYGAHGNVEEYDYTAENIRNADRKLFRSAQNVNSYEDVTPKQNRKFHSVHNFFDNNEDGSHASTSKLMENFDGYSSDRNEGYYNDWRANSEDYIKPRKANFNPVFTESAQTDLDSDDDIRRSRKRFNYSRGDDLYEGDESYNEQRTCYTPYNYDERVPSRIGFGLSNRMPK